MCLSPDTLAATYTFMVTWDRPEEKTDMFQTPFFQPDMEVQQEEEAVVDLDQATCMVCKAKTGSSLSQLVWRGLGDRAKKAIRQVLLVLHFISQHDEKV